MVPFGGPGVMVLAVTLTAVVCAALAVLLRRRVGWDRAVPVSALLWTLTVILVVTLVPAHGPPGIILAAQAQTSCSMDYGGPAPQGFWVFSGGQRLLNTALFVPSGVLLVWTLSRFRAGLRWVVPGLVALVGCSVGIEAVQLQLTRIGRSCDITDLVDNATGAVLGTLIGLVLTGVARLARPAGGGGRGSLTGSGRG